MPHKGDSMATAKKTKAPVTTKTKKVVKKVAKKPTTVKHTTKKKARSSTAKNADFFEMRFSDQSIYWVIFGAAAIVFTLWLFMLDARVRDLYDQIDANNYNTSSMQTVPAGSDDQTTNPAE